MERVAFLAHYGGAGPEWQERQTLEDLELYTEAVGKLIQAKYKKDPMAGLDE